MTKVTNRSDKKPETRGVIIYGRYSLEEQVRSDLRIQKFGKVLVEDSSRIVLLEFNYPDYEKFLLSYGNDAQIEFVPGEFVFDNQERI
jgi:hypothetical protein